MMTKNDSSEFLVLRDEIKSIGKLEKCLSLPYRPSAYSDVDVLPVQKLIPAHRASKRGPDAGSFVGCMICMVPE
jgi:hypothetical protein